MCDNECDIEEIISECTNNIFNIYKYKCIKRIHNYGLLINDRYIIIFDLNKRIIAINDKQKNKDYIISNYNDYYEFIDSMM